MVIMFWLIIRGHFLQIYYPDKCQFAVIEVYFLYLDIIYAIIKMVFINCVVKENIPIEASIDTCANINCISQKHIGELGNAYHDENNSIKTPDASYSTLGKVDLHIGFNDNKKHKSIPTEFC